MSVLSAYKRPALDAYRDDELKRIKFEIIARDDEQMKMDDDPEFWKFFNESDGMEEIDAEDERHNLRLKWALQNLLFPALEVLWKLPESEIFRRPVDPVMDMVPDYLDVIKNPMDLLTVKEKLLKGKYRDPWEFIEDVLLIFKNAQTYNRRSSWVYKNSVKLEEVFKQEMDGIMAKNNYCCGTRYLFKVYNLPCHAKESCTIGKNQKYFQYKSLFSYCAECFNKDRNEFIFPYDAERKAVRKDLCKEMINNKEVEEPLVTCIICGLRSHVVCTLYIPIPYEAGYVCDCCRETSGGTPYPKKASEEFRAEMLKSTAMSAFVESRVNEFLISRETPLEGGPVVIRVVSCSEKDVEVSPLMAKLYEEAGQRNIRFPCRMKVLLAFQRIDGKDVCFFGMITQEYGSACPAPNTRRVYIAFLDSVHFFRPSQFRTAVYHQIIIGYLAFMKNLGFSVAHLWACPPADGNEYIFHCHPPDQKIPKLRRLQDWYKKMLDVGKLHGVVYEWKDIFRVAEQEKIMKLTEIPYFEGDFWPTTLEGFIKSYEKEKAEKATVDEMSPLNKRRKCMKKTPKYKGPAYGDELTNKLYSTMNTHKGLFYVVKLHSPEEARNLGPIVDPDPLIPCEILEARDTFLAHCKDKHFEFSSLRRAKFATLGVLMELLKDNFHCDNCNIYLEERYHCSVCDDLDLCSACYSTTTHEHEMERMGFQMEAVTGNDGTLVREETMMERTRIAIHSIFLTLKHICFCPIPNGPCDLPSCARFKIIVDHFLKCPNKASMGCPICGRYLQVMLTHVRTCSKQRKKICPVPLCTNLKHALNKIKRFADENDHRDSRRRILNATLANWVTSSSPSSSQRESRVSPQEHSPHRLSLEHSEDDGDVAEVSYRPWENVSEELEVPFPVLPPTADSLLAKAPVEVMMDTVLSPCREEERILTPLPILSEQISAPTVSEKESQTYFLEVQEVKSSEADAADVEDEVQIVGEVGGYHQQHQAQAVLGGGRSYLILNTGDNFLDHPVFYQYIQIE